MRVGLAGAGARQTGGRVLLHYGRARAMLRLPRKQAAGTYVIGPPRSAIIGPRHLSNINQATSQCHNWATAPQ